MAGPARYQSFLDSLRNSLAKSPTPVIGEISSDLAVNTAVLIWSCLFNGVRSG